MRWIDFVSCLMLIRDGQQTEMRGKIGWTVSTLFAAYRLVIFTVFSACVLFDCRVLFMSLHCVACIQTLFVTVFYMQFLLYIAFCRSTCQYSPAFSDRCSSYLCLCCDCYSTRKNESFLGAKTFVFLVLRTPSY
jgi:hypothetical protein